ncbi:hypothetical protein J6590_001054 [Homalodisca vitripennis]|nr:hypothetical protein J6590_001054 [Homalodisca vitripennis]
MALKIPFIQGRIPLRCHESSNITEGIPTTFFYTAPQLAYTVCVLSSSLPGGGPRRALRRGELVIRPTRQRHGNTATKTSRDCTYDSGRLEIHGKSLPKKVTVWNAIVRTDDGRWSETARHGRQLNARTTVLNDPCRKWEDQRGLVPSWETRLCLRQDNLVVAFQHDKELERAEGTSGYSLIYGKIDGRATVQVPVTEFESHLVMTVQVRILSVTVAVLGRFSVPNQSI